MRDSKAIRALLSPHFETCEPESATPPSTVRDLPAMSAYCAAAFAEAWEIVEMYISALSKLRPPLMKFGVTILDGFVALQHRIP